MNDLEKIVKARNAKLALSGLNLNRRGKSKAAKLVAEALELSVTKRIPLSAVRGSGSFN